MITRAYSGIAGLFVLAISIPLLASAAIQPRAVVQKPIASCVNGSPVVTLAWGKPTGATVYSVFRNKKPTTVWTNISSKQSSTVLVDKTAIAGATYQYQIKTYFGPTSVSYSSIVSVTIPICTQTPPPPTPATTTPSGEKTFSAYFTGYGWPDNTPPSAAISDGVIHSKAGGTGTYTDPITLAVGHSIISGKDILDYPKGTKFYVPSFRKYLIVEDTCGDGNSPQNGPCHTGYKGNVWLDVWVGGEGANVSSVLSCESKITGVHTVIQNPASNYVVTTGPIFNGVCINLLGETISLKL